MVPSIRFDLDVAPVARSAHELEGFVNAELEDCIRTAGRTLADEARANHNYIDRTRTLTRSIHDIRVSGRATDGDLRGGVEATAPYASYIEDGAFLANGGVIQAREYLGTAYALHREEINSRVVDALENAVFRAKLGGGVY